MQMKTMTNHQADRDGFALVTTLLVVLILSVLAVGAVWMASSERKTTFAEGVHVASVFAADAGGESGINFIRTSATPPRILNMATMNVRTQGTTSLGGTHNYAYDATFMGKRRKPGWGPEYLDYDYLIRSTGTANTSGESAVKVIVSRMYKDGY